MRRLLTLIAAAALALAMGTAPAIGHPVVTGDPCASPGDFAQNHVVPTAQHSDGHGPGVGNSGHNIGGHQGFAGFCNPGNAGS